MIIQTGMRTDIPAFYSQWLLNRIEALLPGGSLPGDTTTKPPKPVGWTPSCAWKSKYKKSIFGYAVRTGVAFYFSIR